MEAMLSHEWKSVLFECSNWRKEGKPSLWWLLQRALRKDEADQWEIANRGRDQKVKRMVEETRSFIGKAGSRGFKFRMNQESIEQKTWTQRRTCMNGTWMWRKDRKVWRWIDLNTWTAWRGRGT